MDYEEFKKEFERRFIPALGKSYSDWEFTSFPVKKRGKTLDGFSVIKSKDDTIRPTLYFNDFYKMYQSSNDFEKTLDHAVNVMKNGFRHKKDIASKIDIENAGSKIIFQLINTADNLEFLEDVPHRDLFDMSVIYRWVMIADNDGITSTVVTNELCSLLKMNEEELYEAAYKNTSELTPPEVIDMEKIISGKELAERIEEDVSDFSKIAGKVYILTNSCKSIGAAMILYEEILYDIAAENDTDFYVLPTSVNEVYLMQANGRIDPDSLLEVHLMLNEQESKNNSKLSDQIFYYSRNSRRLFAVAGEKV